MSWLMLPDFRASRRSRQHTWYYGTSSFSPSSLRVLPLSSSLIQSFLPHWLCVLASTNLSGLRALHITLYHQIRVDSRNISLPSSFCPVAFTGFLSHYISHFLVSSYLVPAVELQLCHQTSSLVLGSMILPSGLKVIKMVLDVLPRHRTQIPQLSASPHVLKLSSYRHCLPPQAIFKTCLSTSPVTSMTGTLQKRLNC
jgi:hypothetical protein